MTTKVTEIDSISDSRFKYSICTLVTQRKEYNEMLESFKTAGFDEGFCEYLYIDNTQRNKYDCFKGISKFLEVAKGDYIIICHQDVVLNFDNQEKLSQLIEEMNVLHPTWGILGNAGGKNIKQNVYRIAYPDGKIFNDGPFPKKVKTLDENFLIIRKSANIGISRNLSGYHLYGTDLCIIASVLGYQSFVIDFLLTHKSYGKPDSSFYMLKNELINKYSKAFKGRYMRTTITIVYISGSSLLSLICNRKWVISVAKFWKKAKNQLNIY